MRPSPHEAVTELALFGEVGASTDDGSGREGPTSSILRFAQVRYSRKLVLPPAKCGITSFIGRAQGIAGGLAVRRILAIMNAGRQSGLRVGPSLGRLRGAQKSRAAKKNRALAGPASSSPAWGRQRITFQRGRNCVHAVANLGGSQLPHVTQQGLHIANSSRDAQRGRRHASHALPAIVRTTCATAALRQRQ
jgi:hypothetical protein